jgi:hypothetical protein
MKTFYRGRFRSLLTACVQRDPRALSSAVEWDFVDEDYYLAALAFSPQSTATWLPNSEGLPVDAEGAHKAYRRRAHPTNFGHLTGD